MKYQQKEAERFIKDYWPWMIVILVVIVIFFSFLISAQEHTTIRINQEVGVNEALSGYNKSAVSEEKYENFINEFLIGIWGVLLGIMLLLKIDKKPIPKALIVVFGLFTIFLFLSFTELYNKITTPLEFK